MRKSEACIQIFKSLDPIRRKISPYQKPFNTKYEWKEDSLANFQKKPIDVYGEKNV